MKILVFTDDEGQITYFDLENSSQTKIFPSPTNCWVNVINMSSDDRFVAIGCFPTSERKRVNTIYLLDI